MKQVITLSIVSSLIYMNAAAQCPCTSPPPKPGMITSSGGSVKVCPGDVRTYTVPDMACVTFNWTPPTGGTVTSGQGTNSVTVQYNAALTNVSNIIVSASNTCGTSPARTKPIYKNTVAPAKPGVMSNTAGLCGLSTVNVSVPNTANTTFNWSTDFNPPSVMSGQGTNTVTLNLSGWTGTPSPNNLKVTATNGCGMTSTERKGVLKLTPLQMGTIITGATSTCSFATHTYSTTSITGASSYDWKAPKGSTISDGVNSGYIANSYSVFNTTSTTVQVTYPNMSLLTGQQYVKVRGVNACGAGTEYKLKVYWANCKTDGEGLEEAQPVYAFDLFPNPANAQATVLYDAEEAGNLQLIVVNMLGEAVLKQSHFVNEGENSLAVDVAQLPAGTYFISILQGEYRHVRQLSVVH